VTNIDLQNKVIAEALFVRKLVNRNAYIMIFIFLFIFFI